jgi:serine/threonine-protein kinase
VGSHALPEGTLVAGKLRIVRLLGEGGMGAVYEVEHELTKHRRALKLLHAEMLAHPGVVARFLREASAAGHIANPHIIETFDAGNLDTGEPYIVMEMLKGEPFDAYMSRRGRLTLAEIVDVVGQACEGVHAANAAGIVHRDLKPENLFLLERDGKPFVKLLDFGISKFDPSLTGANGMTKEGSALGTPYYMSPEQVMGESNIDCRTDVYALGVILYECAAGKKPFEADVMTALAVLINTGNPQNLGELRPDLPPAFIQVVHRAFAKDRAERFQTARELGAALAAFQGAQEVGLGQTMPHFEAQRVVIDTRAGTVGTTGTDGGQAALGATMAISVPGVAGEAAGKPAPSKSARTAAIGGLLVAAGIAAFIGLRRGADLTPRPEVLPTPPAELHPASAPPSAVQVLPPVAPASATTATLAAVPSGAPSAGSAAAGAAGAARAPATPSPAAPAHAAAPSPAAGGAKSSTRVDQKGLASDNPFK